MDVKTTGYTPVRLPPKLRARVVKIAKHEAALRGKSTKKYHGIGRVAEKLIELGLAEYERQQAAKAATA